MIGTKPALKPSLAHSKDPRSLIARAVQQVLQSVLVPGFGRFPFAQREDPGGGVAAQAAEFPVRLGKVPVSRPTQ